MKLWIDPQSIRIYSGMLAIIACSLMVHGVNGLVNALRLIFGFSQTCISISSIMSPLLVAFVPTFISKNENNFDLHMCPLQNFSSQLKHSPFAFLSSY